jgi:hypothetical protein
MKMIDVLKRLAELDAGNPNVENKMGVVENLLTVSNVDGQIAKINEGIEAVEECGGMGMGATMPNHTPASINMSANSGEELSNMLRDIMSLAGVNKDEVGTRRGIELEPAHAIDSNADMLSSIKVIDSMNEPTNEFDVDPNDEPEEGMYNEQPEEGMYANSPEEEIEAHDYGDKQVDPKPQGLKQRVGDNPYTPAHESVESLANRLLGEFHEFINEGKKSKPDFLDMDKDGNKKEPMKKALKDKKPKKKVDEIDEGILHKGAAWLAKKLSSFAGMKALKPGTYIIPPLERMGGKPISFSIDSKSNVPRLNLSGAERNEFELGRLYKHIAAHIQSGNYEVAPSAMQRDYSQKSMPKTRPSKDEEVDEGLGKALLGGAALIAAITGVNKMQVNHMMKTEPQLVTLAQMHQEAVKQGDEYKVKELEDRIEKTLDHILVTGRPVMGGDGEPIDPRNPWAGESIEEANVAVSELTKGAKWKYTDAARKSVNDLADKATNADSRDDSKKFMNKALKRQNSVNRVEKNLVSEKLKIKTR